MSNAWSRLTENRQSVDALKLPHHGSRFNVSNNLTEQITSSRYLFSSNGSRTHHPHPEAVARVIVAQRDNAELVFNYRTQYTEPWEDDRLIDDHRYRPVYPNKGTAGITVNL